MELCVYVILWCYKTPKKLFKKRSLYMQQPLMMVYETFKSARDNFGKFIHQFQGETKTLIRKLERILIKLYRQNGSLCLIKKKKCVYIYIYIHFFLNLCQYIYIYIYIYIYWHRLQNMKSINWILILAEDVYAHFRLIALGKTWNKFSLYLIASSYIFPKHFLLTCHNG